MSSTCYNVFLYAWLNDNFRKELKRILPCFPGPATAGSAGQGLGATVTPAAGLAVAAPMDDQKRLVNGGEQVHLQRSNNQAIQSAQVHLIFISLSLLLPRFYKAVFFIICVSRRRS